MAEKTIPRPRQVSLLGGVIMGGSLFVLLLTFDQMASLGSIEAQESAARLIAEPPASGLGLSVDDVQSILRVLCLVAGGAAAASTILGWQVLMRARSARLALSILAPVLLVAGLSTSGFLAAVVVAAIVMLWLQPARDWFAGVAAPSEQVARRDPSKPDPFGPSTHTSTSYVPPAERTTPAPAAVDQAPHAPHHEQPHQPAQPAHQPAPVYGGHRQAPAPTSRPPQVVAAAVATIVTSSLVAVFVALGVLFVAGDRTAFEDEVAAEIGSNAAYEDLDPSLLADVAIGMLVVFAIWAVVAIVLAVLTLRGSNGARITLVVSAIGAALASLLGVLVVAPLLVTAACVAVAVLLLRRESAAWFTRR
ncbi:proline-rich domain-containing protein [Nocardioides sp. 1609]|uniref:proline-rich domain-containing protein n=1 Tax=Nocardioides sp. 1609 TaxID=2508327 RepID=UPI00106FA51F|nr:proline-rich domain-containing protein [Nocardioides sp. 1609]